MDATAGLRRGSQRQARAQRTDSVGPDRFSAHKRRDSSASAAAEE